MSLSRVSSSELLLVTGHFWLRKQLQQKHRRRDMADKNTTPEKTGVGDMHVSTPGVWPWSLGQAGLCMAHWVKDWLAVPLWFTVKDGLKEQAGGGGLIRSCKDSCLWRTLRYQGKADLTTQSLNQPAPSGPIYVPARSSVPPTFLLRTRGILESHCPPKVWHLTLFF